MAKKIDREKTVIIEVMGGAVTEVLLPRGMDYIVLDRDNAEIDASYMNHPLRKAALRLLEEEE